MKDVPQYSEYVRVSRIFFSSSLCLCFKYVVSVFAAARQPIPIPPSESCLQGWSRPDDEDHPRGRDDHTDDDDDDHIDDDDDHNDNDDDFFIQFGSV